jgi:hypothetical protein
MLYCGAAFVASVDANRRTHLRWPADEARTPHGLELGDPARAVPGHERCWRHRVAAVCTPGL